MTDKEIQEIMAEDANREARLQSVHDPVTGEGCDGERIRLELSDYPIPVMWIPEPMAKQEPVIAALQEAGSVAGMLEKFTGTPPDEDTVAKVIMEIAELRYHYDFEYFAITCIQIKDKNTGSYIAFHLNRGQRRLLREFERQRLSGQPIRVILLKARQWGGSTLTQVYMLWIQRVHRMNWNSVIVAHLRDASVNIRAMYDEATKRMLPIGGVSCTLAGFGGTQNIKELQGRGCLITVGTAQEPESVRSQDAKLAHFSECAFYPDTDANPTQSLITSIVASIPRVACTMVVLETTANGVGGYFYDEWIKAKRGEGGYTCCFVEWFTNDAYKDEVDYDYYDASGHRVAGGIEDFVASLSAYELSIYKASNDVTLAHLNWYRGKLSDMPGPSQMKQEYPSNDIEAFQDSGQPAFRSEDVEQMRDTCRPPIAIGFLVSDGVIASSRKDPKRRKQILQGIQFEPDDAALEAYNAPDSIAKMRKLNNRLKVWAYPDEDDGTKNRYITVYDPSKGRSEGADFGVITTIDRYWMQYGGKPEVVAEWRGHEDKDITIWIAAQIASWYNGAMLVPESNTFESDGTREDESEFIFDTIVKYYPNLYCRTPADKVREGVPPVYGFHTNTATKPMIVAEFVAALRDKAYIERSDYALDEARQYEKKKGGAYGARPKAHDDVLMTRMIGYHVANEIPLPGKRKTAIGVNKAPISEADMS